MQSTIEAGFSSVDEAIDSIAQYQPHRSRTRNYTSVLKNLRLDDNGRYYWHWDPAFVRNDWQGSAEKRERFQEYMLEHTLRIRCPLLLIRGRSSDLVTEETAQQFLDSVPGAEHVDIAGAAHMVAGDSNDVFTEALMQFVDTIGSAEHESKSRL